MKPFPPLIAALTLCAAFSVLTLGAVLFVASAVRPFPRLSLVLLAFAGCLGAFQGAVHWGFTVEKPDIVLPGRKSDYERRRALLGTGAFLWSWLALCVGLLCSVKAGYLLEAAGFTGQFALERVAARWGKMPPAYLAIKLGFTAMVLLGLLLAILSLHG